jgi:hypothetical protein
MIMLDNMEIGNVDAKHAILEQEKVKLMHEANNKTEYDPGNKKRKKTKGARRYLNRQKNVIDAKKVSLLFLNSVAVLTTIFRRS